MYLSKVDASEESNENISYTSFISAVILGPVTRTSANESLSEIFFPHSKNPVKFFKKRNAYKGILFTKADCPESRSHNSIISVELQPLIPTNGNFF